MENFTTNLSQVQIDKGKMQLPVNMILVKMPPAKEIRSKAGVLLNFNEDVLYGEGEGSHVADMAPVWGWVYKTPEGLYYNKFDTERSMGWKTSMPLQVGDKVWFHPLISKNCNQIQTEDALYKFIPFDDLFVGRRGDEVICLNGNVIIEPQKAPKVSEFDIRDNWDNTKGVVKWVGEPVEEYLHPQVADMVGVKPGDLVMLERGTFVFYLERSQYNASFDGDKQYYVVQGRHIIAIVNN